jgi:hypothetical protein
MKVGFSFSSGGLLLPYHMGAMDCLSHNGHLASQTPIAGASAGSIAVASRACGLSSQAVLDATRDISESCRRMGGARGRLLPLLRSHLADFVDEEGYRAASRRGNFCIAYRQVFPSYRAIHQTDFGSAQELRDAVSHSSSFPFFVSNWPVAVDASTYSAYVDGFFAEPSIRHGCPDFANTGGAIEVDRTVGVCVFPRQLVGCTAFEPQDCICPEADEDDPVGQMAELLALATQPSPASEQTRVYESGYKDAERWCLQQQQQLEEKGEKQRVAKGATRRW